MEARNGVDIRDQRVTNGSKAAEGVSRLVLAPRNVEDGGGELGQENEVTNFPGRVFATGRCEGSSEGFVVREYGECAALQEVAEVPDGQVGGKKFLAERTVFGLGRR